jgi:hypothetical protein
MSDLLFPEDGEVRSTGKPHRSPEKKKRGRRKKRSNNHGLKDGQVPESEQHPKPLKRSYRRAADKYFDQPLEVKGRPIYLPSLSDPGAFTIERMLGTPLVF